MPGHDQAEQKILLDAPNSYPHYYPSFVLDFLWYITEENAAYQVLLGGTSVVGFHFFEMFFSQQSRELLGNDWNDHLIKDIRYFMDTTSEYQKEDHIYHKQYIRTRERLAQLPGFNEIFSSLTPLPFDRSRKPFKAGTLYARYRLSERHTLQLKFDAIVQFIPDDPPKHYVTFVPLNQETKAGLILMYLAQFEPMPKNVDDNLLQERLWRLALLKTVEEGLTKGDTDINWEPLAAFNRVRRELDAEFSNLAANPIGEATVRLRTLIERLDEDKLLDKEVLANWAIGFSGDHEELANEEPDEISLSQVQEKLKTACAFWLLTPRGDIIAANLVATWLWEERQLNTKTFFDVNVFEIFTRHRKRIPKDKNDEFFRKKIPILIRLIGGFGKEHYKSFLEYLDTYPDLKQLFDEQKYIPDEVWNSKRIWEFPLIIVPPQGTKDIEFLEFLVTVYRLVPTNEFLAFYEPHPRSTVTQSIVNQKFNEAMAISNASMVDYVQYLDGMKRGVDLTITKEQSPEKPRRVTHKEREVIAENNIDIKTLEKSLEEFRDNMERYLLHQSRQKNLLPSIREQARQELETLRQERVGKKATNAQRASAKR